MLIELPKTCRDPLLIPSTINNSSSIDINDKIPKDHIIESIISSGTSYNKISNCNYLEDLEKCDIEDLNNPQCTAIYNKDIFNYLKSIEVYI